MEERITPDQIAIAVRSLEKSKQDTTEQYERDIAQFNQIIANLNQLAMAETTTKIKPSNGKLKPIVTGPPVKQGKWSGMGLSDAVHAYLSNYKEPIPFGDLMSGLKRRGVRLGNPLKPKRYQANVKTTVIGNRRRFHYDKTNDTVVLVRPADESVAAAG
jgi:hypothetical protein